MYVHCTLHTAHSPIKKYLIKICPTLTDKTASTKIKTNSPKNNYCHCQFHWNKIRPYRRADLLRSAETYTYALPPKNLPLRVVDLGGRRRDTLTCYPPKGRHWKLHLCVMHQKGMYRVLYLHVIEPPKGAGYFNYAWSMAWQKTLDFPEVANRSSWKRKKPEMSFRLTIWL